MNYTVINELETLIGKYSQNLTRMKDAKDNLEKEISDYEFVVEELRIGILRLQDTMEDKYGR